VRRESEKMLRTLAIFDDVFVPWERVFLCGEWEYAGAIANNFANVNRQGYLGADVGKLRLYIGAAQLVAELNGVAHVPHIRDKITEMIRLERSVWACGVTAPSRAAGMAPAIRSPIRCSPTRARTSVWRVTTSPHDTSWRSQGVRP
jgi:aromatic ring hydroxylase